MATMRTSVDALAVTREAKITVAMHTLQATQRATDLLAADGNIYPISKRKIPKERRYKRVRSTRCCIEMPEDILP